MLETGKVVGFLQDYAEIVADLQNPESRNKTLARIRKIEHAQGRDINNRASDYRKEKESEITLAATESTLIVASPRKNSVIPFGLEETTEEEVEKDTTIKPAPIISEAYKKIYEELAQNDPSFEAEIIPSISPRETENKSDPLKKREKASVLGCCPS